MPTVKIPGDLPPEEVCIHRPEPNWFDVREAINKHFMEQKSLSSLPGIRTQDN